MIRSHVFCSKGAKFQNPFATTGPFMTILRNFLGGPGMKILPKVFYNFLCADLMGIPMKRGQKSLHDFVQILSVSRSCGGRATPVCRLQPWFLKIVLRSIPALPIHITFWHIWFCFVPKHFFVKTWENSPFYALVKHHGNSNGGGSVPMRSLPHGICFAFRFPFFRAF